MARTVALWTCLRPDCADKENPHTHSIKGVPVHYFTKNEIPPKEGEKQEYNLDKEMGELMIMDTSDDEEEDPVKFIVVKMTKRHHYISTPYWELTLCDRPDCPQDAQHYHTTYNPSIKPKKPRKVRLTVCTDRDCPHAPALHVHQGNDRIWADIQMPREAVMQTYGRANADMSDLPKNDAEESS